MAQSDAPAESSPSPRSPPPERLEKGRNGSFLPHILALVAVISSATVSITVPFIDSNLERDRLEWQTDEKKREEFRGLLDGSMQRLWAVIQFMYDVQDAWLDKDTTAADLQPLSKRAIAFLNQTTLDTERIGLRAGDNAAVTRAHKQAARHVVAVELAVRSRQNLNDWQQQVQWDMHDEFVKFKAAQRYLAAPID